MVSELQKRFAAMNIMWLEFEDIIRKRAKSPML